MKPLIHSNYSSMKILKKILNRGMIIGLFLLKIIVFWVITLPTKLNIFASLMYFGLMYLFFGTASMGDIQYRIFEDNWYAQALIFIFFGLPALIGFFTFLGVQMGETPEESINSAIKYRNNRMKYAGSKEAYEIMKDTAHLDVISKDPAFRQALNGFHNTNRNAGPATVYKNLRDKTK
jgi:hypothetical protein